MTTPDDPRPPDPCDLDNAIERERVAGYWRERAPVIAWLVLLGMVLACEMMRGLGR